MPHVPLLLETLRRLVLPPYMAVHINHLATDRVHGAAELAGYAVQVRCLTHSPMGNMHCGCVKREEQGGRAILWQPYANPMFVMYGGRADCMLAANMECRVGKSVAAPDCRPWLYERSLDARRRSKA